jgi:putative hydrolase
VRRITAQSSTQSWIEWALDDQQREIFYEMQVLMSLIEGHSNYVMNRIGAQKIGTFGQLHQRMEARQHERPTLDSLIMRVTGMQMKMAQYRDGEAFVTALAAHGGDALVRYLWTTSGHLPTAHELAHPDEWIRRYAGQRNAYDS